MWPRSRVKHAPLTKQWKTECLPASHPPLPLLLQVWGWELLGKVATAVEGAPDQSPATLPAAASSARILWRKKRRKSCSVLVVDLTTTAERAMRPPLTLSAKRITQTGYRSLHTLLVHRFIVILPPVRSQLKSFHECRHPLPRPHLTSPRYREPVSQ